MKYVPRDLGASADISRGRLPPRSFAKWLVGIAGLLVLGYGAVTWLGEAIAVRLSPAREARIFGGLDLPGARGPDPAQPAERQALDVFERLAAARVPSDGCAGELPYQLSIVNSEVPNAFALPGGRIGVTTGLLTKVPSETGVAFVIAHEMGHHQHRHTMRRLGRQLAVQLLLGLVFNGDIHPAVSSLEHIMGSAYSRQQEREADDHALRLVHKVYGTTEGALALFELLSEKESPLDRRFGALGATHPLTSERLNRLRAEAQRLEGQTH